MMLKVIYEFKKDNWTNILITNFIIVKAYMC